MNTPTTNPAAVVDSPTIAPTKLPARLCRVCASCRHYYHKKETTQATDETGKVVAEYCNHEICCDIDTITALDIDKKVSDKKVSYRVLNGHIVLRFYDNTTYQKWGLPKDCTMILEQTVMNQKEKVESEETKRNLP